MLFVFVQSSKRKRGRKGETMTGQQPGTAGLLRGCARSLPPPVQGARDPNRVAFLALADCRGGCTVSEAAACCNVDLSVVRATSRFATPIPGAKRRKQVYPCGGYCRHARTLADSHRLRRRNVHAEGTRCRRMIGLPRSEGYGAAVRGESCCVAAGRPRLRAAANFAGTARRSRQLPDDAVVNSFGCGNFGLLPRSGRTVVDWLGRRLLLGLPEGRPRGAVIGVMTDDYEAARRNIAAAGRPTSRCARASSRSCPSKLRPSTGSSPTA